MLKVDKGSVMVSRGDTGNLTVQFDGDVPQDGTLALVTVKKNPVKTEFLWEKRLTVQGGRIDIRLNTEDTNFPPDKYYWDVRLLRGAEIFTPVEPQPFTVLEVVGNA